MLLAWIGGNMIRESLSKEEERTDANFGFKSMLPLAVATSIGSRSLLSEVYNAEMLEKYLETDEDEYHTARKLRL